MAIGKSNQLVNAFLIPRLFHNQCVLNLSPFVAGRIVWPSPQTVTSIDIPDAHFFKSMLESFPIELRVMAAIRHTTYIHQYINAMLFKEFNDTFRLNVAVSDSKNIHGLQTLQRTNVLDCRTTFAKTIR